MLLVESMKSELVLWWEEESGWNIQLTDYAEFHPDRRTAILLAFCHWAGLDHIRALVLGERPVENPILGNEQT